MTTLTVFIQEPLFGILRNMLGKSARKKNGDANVIEKASAPRVSLPKIPNRAPYSPALNIAETFPKEGTRAANPPMNGATHEKLIMENVSAMKIVPIMPPRPCCVDV